MKTPHLGLLALALLVAGLVAALLISLGGRLPAAAAPAKADAGATEIPPPARASSAQPTPAKPRAATIIKPPGTVVPPATDGPSRVALHPDALDRLPEGWSEADLAAAVMEVRRLAADCPPWPDGEPATINFVVTGDDKQRLLHKIPRMAQATRIAKGAAADACLREVLKPEPTKLPRGGTRFSFPLR